MELNNNIKNPTKVTKTIVSPNPIWMKRENSLNTTNTFGKFM